MDRWSSHSRLPYTAWARNEGGRRVRLSREDEEHQLCHFVLSPTVRARERKRWHGAQMKAGEMRGRKKTCSEKGKKRGRLDAGLMYKLERGKGASRSGKRGVAGEKCARARSES